MEFPVWISNVKVSLLCAVIWLAIGQSGYALPVPVSVQQGPAGEVEMPHDPAALMALAGRLNGLVGAGMKPWHLKIAYTVLDEKGATKEAGSVEEWWVGPRENRTTYTVGSESETIYVTEDGKSRTGKLVQESDLVSSALQEFADPLPSQAYIQRQSFLTQSKKVGEANLTCAAEKPGAGDQHVGPPPAMYCFNSDKPILRIDLSGYGKWQAVRNAIVVFQGTYVPKEIRITEQSNASVTAHLESLEVLKSVEDADFKPPAEARPVPGKVAISSGVAQGLLIKQVAPQYPAAARSAHVSGTVVVRVRIGTDGQVHDPEVVSGPLQLRQAALDAIKDWLYRPYLLNGDAVEVETQINLTFNVGGG